MKTEITKQRLLEAGYSETENLDEIINRLISLQGKAAELFIAWVYEGKEPSFEPIEGIDSVFLKTKLNMKDPAIIIAYSMLLENAREEADYFKYLADNIIGFYPVSQE